MQPLQADLAGAPRGGLKGQGLDLSGRQQAMGVEQAQDLELPGPMRTRITRSDTAEDVGNCADAGSAGARTLREMGARGLVIPGVAGMGQSLELPELGPYGNRQLEVWGSQGSWAWGSRWNCKGLDPAGIASSRIGDPRVVGMGQSPELRGLGPHGNRQLEDWRCQGLWVWGSRWNCEGLDPTGIGTLRIGDPRGRGHGAAAGAARAWIGRNPYPQDEDRRGQGVGVRVNSSTKRKVTNA